MWLIRAYGFLHAHAGNHFLASSLLGVLPAGLLGLLIWTAGYEFQLTAGQWIMFGWLLFAPYMVWKADDSLDHLFRSVGSVHGEGAKSAMMRGQQRLRSHKQWLFSIPWALAVALLGTLPLGLPASNPLTIWVFSMLFLAFLVSGIGFNGVVAVLRMFQELRSERLTIEPYASDGIGGLQPFSQLSMLATLLFSTGALGFPLAYEVVQVAGEISILRYMVFLLAAVYIIAILAVFLGPMMALQNILGSRKKELLRESNRYMEETFQEARQAAGESAQIQLDRLKTHFEVFHRRLENIKDYPYDLRIIFELLISLAIPITVAVFQHNFLSS